MTPSTYREWVADGDAAPRPDLYPPDTPPEALPPRYVTVRCLGGDVAGYRALDADPPDAPPPPEPVEQEPVPEATRRHNDAISAALFSALVDAALARPQYRGNWHFDDDVDRTATPWDDVD